MLTQDAKWLEERRLGIGGSDAASVLNEGYGCARRLFYDKTGVAPDYGHTEKELRLFERGHKLEEIIADSWAEDTGNKIRRWPAKVSKERPWMRVNMDRQILNDPRGVGYLECKSANPNVLRMMFAEGMPPHYVIQVQHGLVVSDYKWGVFTVREPSSWEPLSFEVQRNEDLIAVLVKAEEQFWHNNVLAGVAPPQLEATDKRCRSCQWRKTCRGQEALVQIAGAEVAKTEYEEDDSLADLLAAYQMADFNAENAAAIVDQLKDQIKERLGARSAVSVPAMGARIHFKEQAGRLQWDGKALDADHPELAEKYKRRTAGSRPFRVIFV